MNYGDDFNASPQHCLSDAAWWCRRNLCAHPEVLRIARNSLFGQPNPLGSAITRALPVMLPPARNSSLLVMHFENMAHTTMQIDHGTLGSHIMLSGLPQVSPEVAIFVHGRQVMS